MLKAVSKQNLLAGEITLLFLDGSADKWDYTLHKGEAIGVLLLFLRMHI